MKKTRIIVIGDGIAAWSSLFLLKKQIFETQNLDNIEIIQIANNDLAPSCSYASTAINCLRGTQKGLSELGDLIVDSYEYFKELHETYHFKGVEKSTETQYWKLDSKNKEKWEKRYPDFKTNKLFHYFESEAYLITPEIVGADLKSRFFDHEFIKAFVTKIENNILYTNNNEIRFDKLIMCLSHESKLFLDQYQEVNEKVITHAKPVSGSYLEFDLDLNRQGFSYALEGHHLIYKNENKKLLIGSTTENGSDSYIADIKKLKSIYEEVSCAFYKEITIPDFNEALIKIGVRQKGYKRLPFFGKINKDIYSLHSLYKNGFTFAFYGAREICKKLI